MRSPRFQVLILMQAGFPDMRSCRYQRDTCYRLERLGQAREQFERHTFVQQSSFPACTQAQEEMEALAQKRGSKLVKEIADTRQRNGKNLPRLLEAASRTFTQMQTTLTNALLERYVMSRTPLYRGCRSP